MNKTVNKAIRILDLISKHKNGLSLSEIAEKTNLAKSSTYDILDELLNEHILELKEKKYYVIGIKAFEIGTTYINNTDVVTKGKSDIETLAEALNKTAFIGTLQGDEVIYIYKFQGTNAKLTACNIGTHKKLYYTALGKVLLAYMDESERNNIIKDTNFVKHTEYTITNKEQLIADLEQIKRQGFSVDNREGESHMLCFGAPIFDYSGKVVASASISDLYDEKVNINDLGNKLKDVCLNISRKLGYNK
ncbi:MAG: transcriptional regulator, IclR family [Haloplasmataceae bacterium]|jgi:DNA-binding IclR family transcriptional regulator|nr:transcriptional regulator, IclR family [Haloplasmataceae bacterium]